MTASEHPEQALDRAIAGTSTPETRHLLERHLAICGACKAHLVLASVARASFRVHPWDGPVDRLNIERAMVRARVTGSSALSSRLGKRVMWLAAAATLALSGIASAAWLHATYITRNVDRRSPTHAQGRRPDATGAPVSMGATLQPLVSPAPEEGAARHFNPATPNPSNVQASSADALFRMASALRAQGQAEAAIATFQKLESLFPDSRESRFSYVIAGRLLLTRGRPAQALSEFDQYLARRGAASEDALAGRAAALQALGQTDAEAETWQRVLAEYPKSVYDTRARARLTLLEPAKALPADSSAP